ncbi:hypothetical protein FO440_18425 [Mucilaginibacter corticis]|uniref:Uncharacterized protein n=1 Tax=Mucilaginibacter corticis TaxID=2597670 RepID=A0A556MIH1_9SPHI|nr:hypothetical protein [Mucilaginibacter corticis]TSJ39714.1 hypothetical protein FO440_18425 [Mucilaginibacter corticis]
MKKTIVLAGFGLLCCFRLLGQSVVNDEALRYQEQRMVYQQWDQNKFKPSPGFLSLNPYYWLVWGFFHPDYHKTDLRPLSPNGPQTQRLAFVAAMSNTDNHYKLQSDTVKTTALSQVAATSGLVSDLDPLWLLYYKNQFDPVLNFNPVKLSAGLSPQANSKLVSEGTLSWYGNELNMLKQRIQAAHTADMDRGSRILAYYRLLNEYRKLAGVWSVRTSSAQSTLDLAAQQQTLKSNNASVPDWTPQTDISIAKKILQKIQ